MSMSSMFVSAFVNISGTTKMTKNKDLELVKRYLEGALSVKTDGSDRHEGYQQACRNVYAFIENVEKRVDFGL